MQAKLRSNMTDNGQTPDIGALISGIAADPAIMSTVSKLLSANAEREPPATREPDLSALAAAIKLFTSASNGSEQSAKRETRGNSPKNSAADTFANESLGQSGAWRDTGFDNVSEHVSERGGERDSEGNRSFGNGRGNGKGGFAPSGLLSGEATLSLKRLLGGRAEAENRIRLLNALRPYLCDERRSKLDTVIKLLKLAELGEVSGLFG